MGDLIYKPLIDDMTWSYSRIKTFFDCPYRFFLKYIHGAKERDMFYSNYGKFMHDLINKYISGQISRENMKIEYILNFDRMAKGIKPSEKTVIRYFEDGINYINNISDMPFDRVATEKSYKFKIDGEKFVGVLDFLGKKNDDLYIVDHKSKIIKPRSKNKNATTSNNCLDEMLMQLYIYSEPVLEEFGRYPKELCFNCFRNGTLVREKFDEDRFYNSKNWVTDSINEIKNCDEFNPKIDYYKCNYICGLNSQCEYYKTVFSNKREG